jgi:hypothetical protein
MGDNGDRAAPEIGEEQPAQAVDNTRISNFLREFQPKKILTERQREEKISQSLLEERLVIDNGYIGRFAEYFVKHSQGNDTVTEVAEFRITLSSAWMEIITRTSITLISQWPFKVYQLSRLSIPVMLSPGSQLTLSCPPWHLCRRWRKCICTSIVIIDGR